MQTAALPPLLPYPHAERKTEGVRGCRRIIVITDGRFRGVCPISLDYIKLQNAATALS